MVMGMAIVILDIIKVMLDIHCHILPGLDDGSPDIETSVKMAEIAVQDGIRAVIATPHVGANDLDRSEVIEQTVLLNNELTKRKIDLTIYPGAEIQSHLAVSLAEVHTLGFGQSILIEFPHSFLPSDSVSLVRTLVAKEYRVIIAHAERNYTIAFEPDKASELIQAGAEIQVTAESITGFQGPDPKRCADYLLQRKWVHYIGTDSHSPTFRRPTLSRAVQVASKIIGNFEAIKLVTTNPEKLLSTV